MKSEKLNVYTIEQTKVALSNFDNKRYILDDGYTTLAHGHYQISQDGIYYWGTSSYALE